MGDKAQLAKPPEQEAVREGADKPSEGRMASTSVESQSGRVARAADPEVSKILNLAEGAAKGTSEALSAGQLADRMMTRKASLDSLAAQSGTAPGAPGWDVFLKNAKNNPLDDQKIKDGVTKAVQDAFAKGGREAVTAYIMNANDKVQGPFGPSARFNSDGTLTVSFKGERADKTQYDLAKPFTFPLEAAKQPDASDKPAQAGSKPPSTDGAVGSALALTKAVVDLGKLAGGEWKPSNEVQARFLEFAKNNKDDLSKIPPEIMSGLASSDTKALNKFLKDHGFNGIELKPLSENGIGVVTATSIEGQWRGKDAAPITSNGKQYNAFSLKTDEVYKVAGSDQPVVKLYEKDGIKVYATPYTGAPLGDIQASEMAMKLTPGQNPQKFPGNFEEVTVPNTDMSRVVEMNWLKNFKNQSGHAIDQALNQTEVQMNKFGFKAKDGVALGADRSISVPKNFTFNQPFLFWIEKDGVKAPLTAVVIDQSYWKDPPINDKKRI